MEAKTVKVGSKYYKEGVEVDAPVQKKPVSEGLAGSSVKPKRKPNKIQQQIASDTSRRNFFRSLAGGN